MKKVITIIGLCSLLVVATASGLYVGKVQTVQQDASGDYAILTYSPDSWNAYNASGDRFAVHIMYGNENPEHIAFTDADRKKYKTVSNAVIPVLARLKQEGYTLVSTSLQPYQGPGGMNEFYLFLRK